MNYTQHMVRCLTAFFVALWVLPHAYAECELRSAWRGSAVQHYVPKVHDCLNAPRSGIWFDEAVEAKVFALINQERVRVGVRPLEWRAELRPAARIHSFDMAQEGFFAHQGRDGRTVSMRRRALDRTLIESEIRENIASIGGDLSYEDVAGFMHTQLMESEGHRKNILAPNVTHMAIGLARKEKGAWITQVFVRKEGVFETDFPLVMNERAAPLPSAVLHDWEFVEIRLSDMAGTDLIEMHTGPISIDNANLSVIGMKRVDEYRRRTIELRGPLVSIDRSAVAKESAP